MGRGRKEGMSGGRSVRKEGKQRHTHLAVPLPLKPEFLDGSVSIAATSRLRGSVAAPSPHASIPPCARPSSACRTSTAARRAGV